VVGTSVWLVQLKDEGYWIRNTDVYMAVVVFSGVGTNWLGNVTHVLIDKFPVTFQLSRPG